MRVKLLDRTGLRSAAIAAKTYIGRADDGRDMNAGRRAGACQVSLGRARTGRARVPRFRYG